MARREKEGEGLEDQGEALGPDAIFRPGAGMIKDAAGGLISQQAAYWTRTKKTSIGDTKGVTLKLTSWILPLPK